MGVVAGREGGVHRIGDLGREGRGEGKGGRGQRGKEGGREGGREGDMKTGRDRKEEEEGGGRGESKK